MALPCHSGRLLSKFRGCLCAAVAGDVLGWDFEFGSVEYTAVVQHVESPDIAYSKRGKLQFTDDTAMARSVAESLIKNRGYNAKDMAQRFAREYKKEPFRAYGRNVMKVFDKLLDPSLEDVYKPARDQFNGTGSYGNGGAMRVAPVALFAYHDFEEMVKIAKKNTLLTHFHHHGYNGAILQCAAVHLALHHDDKSSLDANEFLDKLIEYMDEIEDEVIIKDEIPRKKVKGEDGLPKVKGEDCLLKVKGGETNADPQDVIYEKPYCVKLKKLKSLLGDPDPTTDRVVEILGNGVSAYKSVPTAIFSFLHCLKPSPNISSNGLVRTITYAISLGGDTDTIATMAGAIAGAYYGMESIPENWKTCCEGMDDAVQYANQFYELVTE
ncbi:ADP-ribosylhydrolase ARH3-like [Glandiceps talaboti]